MDVDSDSDDGLLPSMDSFGSLFNSVQQQVRRELPNKTVTVKGGSSGGKDSDSESKRKLISNGKSASKKHKATDLTHASSKPATEPPIVKLSDDTESLLAQADSLNIPVMTNGGPSSSSGIKKDVSTRKTRSGRTIEEVDVTEPGKRRGRRKKKGATKKKVAKKSSVVLVSLDDEDTDDCGCAADDSVTQEASVSMDDFPRMECSQTSDILEVETVEELWTLRVQWKEETFRFQVPIGTKLSQLRNEVGQKVSLRADDLVLIDEKTSEEVSDNISVEDFPFGTTLSAFHRIPDTTNPKKLGPDFIQLKVQGSGGYRERLPVAIKRTTHISQLIDDFVIKFKLEGRKFKLIFDGDVVDLTETAESLDLDGGEMFDIVEIT